MDFPFEIHSGDALEHLREMPERSIHCCVTSPPYWGLRDYGVSGQIGLEAMPEEYVAKLVGIFREVRRVLRDDGTLWLNLGDSYARDPDKGQHRPGDGGKQNYLIESANGRAANTSLGGLKPKDMVGIPWRVAFALQADGWYLRSDIIWSKLNPMPESVADRPTKAHEYVFLLAKSERYYFDAMAVREPDAGTDHRRMVLSGQASLEPSNGLRSAHKGIRTETGRNGDGRNVRSVWKIATEPFPEAHFATFPTELAKRCILAGCPKNGTVLDPFAGAGTTGLVSNRLDRAFIGIELNPAYVKMALRRIRNDAPLFNSPYLVAKR